MNNLADILTVTLNPAIDQIVNVPFLHIGTENKVIFVAATAGGKGINVSRTLKCLGVPSIAAGFAGGANGQNLLRELLLEGIEHNFVFIQGETRVNLTIQDQKTGKSTRILNEGPVIDKKDLASFRHKFSRLAQASEWIVLSGRGIRGTPPDFYRELVETGGKAGSKVIVDTCGRDLLAALRGKPFLVKLNQQEAQEILKQKLHNRQQLKEALKKFLKLGSQRVIISLGAQGAVGTDGENCYCAASSKVKIINTVGCGDALTAGFIYAFREKNNFRDALAFAVAAGTASALTAVPGKLSRAQLTGILPKVIVKDL